MPTPCTVTGTLESLSAGGLSAYATVTFALTNIGTGNPVTVSGTAIIPALTTTLNVGGGGTFTTPLWGNDVISPANTLYAVTFSSGDPSAPSSVGPILYSITGSSVNLNTAAATSTTLPPVLTTGTVLLTKAAPTVSAGQIGLGSTTATSATAGSNGAVPAQVLGYVIANVGGTTVKIPYYNT